MDDWLVSRAHEWVQMDPPNGDTLACTRCGISVELKSLRQERRRCAPHYERPSSGFLMEDANGSENL
jgi:hypothetical protein